MPGLQRVLMSMMKEGSWMCYGKNFNCPQKNSRQPPEDTGNTEAPEGSRGLVCLLVVLVCCCFVFIKKETSWHCLGLTVRFKGPGANPADLKQAKQMSTTYGLHRKNPLPLKNSKNWNPVKQA